MKEIIMNKMEFMDASFLTTCPTALNFIPQNKNIHYIPNPADHSFETLNNFNKFCNVDVFFALSHGVHRGVLKSGKIDDRVKFLDNLTKKLIDKTTPEQGYASWYFNGKNLQDIYNETYACFY